MKYGDYSVIHAERYTGEF